MQHQLLFLLVVTAVIDRLVYTMPAWSAGTPFQKMALSVKSLGVAAP